MNGCRPDQLFGLWAIEETRFAQMVALAKAVDLEAIRKEAAAKEAQTNKPEAKPYALTPDGIAQISINGPMTKYPTSFQDLFGGTATLTVRHALRDAARSDSVSGIMLIVDSPGGSVAGTAELALEIRAAAERKPVHAFVDDLAASAALWAASQAPVITASRGAEVGSIGAYMVVYDQSGMAAQDGVKVFAISSAPPHKGAGVAGTEVTEEQRAEFGRRVKDLADQFVAEVAAGRGDRLAGKGTPLDRAQALHTGQMWIADKAKELGLIDAVGSLDDAMASLRRKIMVDTENKDALAMAANEEQKRIAAEAKLAEATANQANLVQQLAEANAKLAATEKEGRAKRFSAEAEAFGCTTAFADVLDTIEAAVGEETYKNLKTQLAALSKQVEVGDLFKEKGSSSDATADLPQDALKALANQILAKGEAKDYFAAYALACQRKPELVNAAKPGRKGD